MVPAQAAARSPPSTCSPKTRYTDALPIPSRRAISEGMTPSALSLLISAACRRAVGTRPLYRPSRLALAIPSRWRSSMASRSAWPTAPMTASINLPVAVLVSRGCVPDIDRTSTEPAARHSCPPTARRYPAGRPPTSPACPTLCRRTDPLPGRSRVPLLAADAQPPMTPARGKSCRTLLPEAHALGFQAGGLTGCCPSVTYDHRKSVSHGSYVVMIPQVSNLSSDLCETDFSVLARGWSTGHGSI